MALVMDKVNVTTKKILTTSKVPSICFSYDIPERYKNSFYLANASFYDSVNWFLHRSYEVVYPILVEKLKNLEPNRTDTQRGEMVDGMYSVMDQCNSIIDVRFPVRKDNGIFEVVRGFRAQHGLATGCYGTLGGFRIGDNITRDQMKGLAVLATYRNACMGIYMGGAHGGLKINPEEYSEKELEQIMQGYACSLYQKGFCNSYDVMQPDINSSSNEMGWVTKALPSHDDSALLAASGKYLDFGGIEGYNEMSCQGVYFALNNILQNEELMKRCQMSSGLQDKTFIIQGLGKLGAPLARLLVRNGAVCVGVKDTDACHFDANGINIEKLFEYKQKYGTIIDYEIAKPDTTDSIYKEKCDILIFAATHKSLNCYTASDVKARLIIEAADHPITPTAHRILTTKSQLVVPDIYACSGATIASYVEYLWNLQQLGKLDNQLLSSSNEIYRKTLEDSQFENKRLAAHLGSSISYSTCQSIINRSAILDTLESIINETGKEIFKYTELLNLGTDLRTAAYIVGISNIFKSLYQHKRFF